jgi:CHAD domain-containing protein
VAYRLQSTESVREGLRRCAREQIDRAIDELTDGVKADPVAAVHDARKAFKKARSVLRLGVGTIRPRERRRVNAGLRQAGQVLSAPRDAEVMIQAVDALADRFAGRVPKATFDAIHARLDEQAAGARSRLTDSGLAGEVAEELESIRQRTAELPLRRGGWRAIEPGLIRGYRRGRRALELARAEPTAKNLHEWRKRAKDLWYHLRLLTPTSPGIVGGHADEAHRLSDVLGDDHDLAVLAQTLASLTNEIAADLDPVLALIVHRRHELQHEVLLLGDRLYAERPRAFARRIHRYWKAWRAGARAAQAHRPVAVA